MTTARFTQQKHAASLDIARYTELFLKQNRITKIPTGVSGLSKFRYGHMGHKPEEQPTHEIRKSGTPARLVASD